MADVEQGRADDGRVVGSPLRSPDGLRISGVDLQGR
jgi:hypothetical protein